MTLTEFGYEFDVLYNNISSGAAPGLNNYEKSLLLTNAQEVLVKAYYTGDIKALIPSFEETERRRRELGELVRTYSTSLSEEKNTIVNFNLATKKIDSSSLFFVIPSDVWYILYEKSIAEPDPCIEGENLIKIIPIKLDYYNTQINNPFRKPNKDYGWRLDIEQDKTNPVVEIMYLGRPIIGYFMRYIHRPQPIILSNLDEDPELEGLGLTIRGSSGPSECELQSLDKEILQLAVDTAILRYRENSLQNIKNF